MILQNAERSNVQLQKDLQDYEMERTKLIAENFQLKSKNIDMETKYKGFIDSRESENIKVENDKLKTECVSLKAAMQTYKSMNTVYAD